ncbi:MAG: hypothetical protein MJ221_04980 [Bacilli bacterium]|nr:hypothetical protein [Bacilli bacterium]
MDMLDFSKYPLNVFDNSKCINFLIEIGGDIARDITQNKESQKSVSQICSEQICKSILSSFSPTSAISRIFYATYFDYLKLGFTYTIQQIVTMLLSQSGGNLNAIIWRVTGAFYMSSRHLLDHEEKSISHWCSKMGTAISSAFRNKSMDAFVDSIEIDELISKELPYKLSRIYSLALLMNYYVSASNLSFERIKELKECTKQLIPFCGSEQDKFDEDILLYIIQNHKKIQNFVNYMLEEDASNILSEFVNNYCEEHGY